MARIPGCQSGNFTTDSSIISSFPFTVERIAFEKSSTLAPIEYQTDGANDKPKKTAPNMANVFASVKNRFWSLCNFFKF